MYRNINAILHVKYLRGQILAFKYFTMSICKNGDEKKLFRLESVDICIKIRTKSDGILQK